MKFIQSTERASRPLRLLSASALVVTWSVWLVIVLYAARMVSAHAYDFNTYYVAAEALRFNHQANIYSVPTLTHIASAHGACPSLSIPGYLYPPLLAAALEPLTLLPCTSASTLWVLLNAALWAAATIMLALTVARRWPRRRRLDAFTLVSLLSLGCWQAFDGMFLGQIHLLLFFGIALALWLHDHQHPWLAGAALGAITIVKIVPIVLVGYYLLRGRLRIVAGAALTGTALVVLMLLTSSPATVGYSIPAVFASMPTLVTPGQNEALTVALPDRLGLLLAALVGIAFTVITLISRWWPGRGNSDALLGAGFALCTMLLISPLVWSFYLIWLIPALCACLVGIGDLVWHGEPGQSEAPPCDLSQRPHGRAARLVWASLALLTASLVILALPSAQPLHPFATLALWGLLGALYWRSSKTPPAAATSSIVETTTDRHDAPASVGIEAR